MTLWMRSHEERLSRIWRRRSSLTLSSKTVLQSKLDTKSDDVRLKLHHWRLSKARCIELMGGNESQGVKFLVSERLALRNPHQPKTFKLCLQDVIHRQQQRFRASSRVRRSIRRVEGGQMMEDWIPSVHTQGSSEDMRRRRTVLELSLRP